MEKDYTVRLAEEGDLPRILEIYAYARGFMSQTGNATQWGEHYPPKALLQKDIMRNCLHVVVKDSRIHGVFYFAQEEDPTYRNIFEGKWRQGKLYGVIHRVASDGSGGIFGACLAFCKGRIDYLRIDTHHDNHVMQRVLEKHGFTPSGIIYVEDGSPRIAYEWI